MTLKFKISAFSIFAILALSAVLLYSGSLIQNLVESRYKESTYNRNDVVFQQVVDVQVGLLNLAAPNFTRNRDLIKTVKKKKYDETAELLRYAGNRLTVGKTLEAISIFDKDGNSIMSYPQNINFSANQLLSHIRQTNKPSYSLEIESDQKVKINYIFPIFYRGKPTGYVSFVKNLDDVIVNLKKYLDAEIFIFSYDKDKNIYSTLEKAKLKSSFGLDGTISTKLDRIESTDKIEEYVATSLRNFDKKPIAYLVTLKDYTVNFTKEKEYKNNSIIAIAGGVIFFSILMIIFLTLSFKPLTKFADDMHDLAEGKLDIDIDTSRKDEIGPMANAMEIFKKNALDKIALEEKQLLLDEQAKQDKKDAMNKLADSFENRVSGVVDGVFTAGEETNKTSHQISEIAASASKQAELLKSSSQQSSDNVSTVASATEELTASISEVKTQINNSTEITHQASDKAENANEAVASLINAATKIDDVLGLIANITEKINLLALNATIEAARAGEAGKGFAVVATEVKNLANQTYNATQEISSVIIEMQNQTNSTAEIINDVSATIIKVNEIADNVSVAFAEQEYAIQEIAKSASQASMTTNQLSDGVIEVSEGAKKSGQSADVLLASSDNLSKQATILKKEVDSFIAEIRS